MINTHDSLNKTHSHTEHTERHKPPPEHASEPLDTGISEEDRQIVKKNWTQARQKALAALSHLTIRSPKTQQTENANQSRQKRPDIRVPTLLSVNFQKWPEIRTRALASLYRPDYKGRSQTPPKSSALEASPSQPSKNGLQAIPNKNTALKAPTKPSKKDSAKPTSSASKKTSAQESNAVNNEPSISVNDPSNLENGPVNSVNDSSKSENDSSKIRQFAGSDGFFYFLTPDGDLHRYDPTVDAILNTGQKNISLFTMGANSKPYALKDQRLVNLNAYGAITQVCSGTLTTDDKIKDIAVSPLGDTACLLNESGGLFTLDLKDLTATPTPLKCPLETSFADFKSVAIGADSSVWLLGENNQLFQGQHTSNPPFTGKMQWSAIKAPEQHLVSLETLQGGKVCGRTADDDILTLRNRDIANSEKWQNVDFQNIAQSSFQIMNNALSKQNPLELITFLGGTATGRAFSKDTLLKPAKALGNVAKSIPQLFEDLKHFDYKKTQTPSIERFHKQTAQDFKSLKESSLSADFQQTASHTALISSALAKSISDDTLSLLNKLDAHWKPPVTKRELSLKIKTSNKPEENIIQIIKDARSAVYNSEDPVMKKLDQMLAQGQQLHQNTPRYQGLIAKLLSDHASLINTATLLSTAEESQTNGIIQQQIIQRKNALPNLLIRSGVADTDPFGHAAQGFDSMQAIFRQKKDLLNRIVDKYRPAIEGKSNGATSPRPNSEIFNDLIQAMKPGDTLSVGKGMDAGFNTETFRVVFSGAWASLTGGLANTWVIPILDFGKLKDVELSLSKTQQGLNINISRSKGSYFQTGIRGGVGVVELPDVSSKKVGTAWGFQGFEVAVKDRHSTGINDAINLTIHDNGQGNIQKTIADVMTGNADLFELLRQANDTSIAHTTAKAHNVTVGNVGVVAGGITMPGWDAALEGKHSEVSSLFPVGKVLGAIVPEVAFDFGSKEQASKISNNLGEEMVSQTKQPFGLQGVRANMIGVGVLESDYLARALGGDMMIGAGEEALGITGRSGIPSILPGAILGKSFGLLAPTSKTVSLLSSEDEMPQTLNVSLTINRTKNLERMVNNLNELSELSGLKEALHALTHQQKKRGFNRNMPVNLALELKPECRNNLPTEKEARKEALIQLGKDLNNFRISSMNVKATRQDSRTKSLPIPAITRSVKASISATQEFANINFIYNRDSAIKETLSTIQKIMEFSDATWGVKNSQQRLTYLKQTLENTIDAFGQTNDDWEKGQSLKKNYDAEFNALKDELLKKSHTAMINKFEGEYEKELTKAFSKFVNDSAALREKFKLNEFDGPAIISSGPLFVDPYAGTMDRAGSLKFLKDLPLEKIETQIKKLAKMDLSSKSGKALAKEKQKVEEEINSIKRLLGTASDINIERKERFLLDLYLLPARPSNSKQAISLVKQLNNLGKQ